MASNVVCVSRTLGAGGDEVARLVAERLGFRYVDDEIVVRAAEAADVSEGAVAEAEHKRPLIARILTAMAAAPAPEVGGYVALPVVSPDYERLIEEVVKETADAGRVVIAAHAASIPLSGKEGVLRVFVTASSETRAARLAREGELDERAAARAVRDSDGERQDYRKRFYRAGEEQPTDYDLVINTDALSVEQAATVVVAAAQAG